MSKLGSLVRAFELGEPLSDHWLQKLVAALQPDPTELRHCLELDQAEAAEQLERSPSRGILTWTRRERTWFDARGVNSIQRTVTFRMATPLPQH